MRRAGHNPTDVEIVTIINKYENESGSIDLKVVIIFKTSFVQLNSTSLLCLVFSAACSFHHCYCCQLGSKPVFTHECLSKIGLVTLKYDSQNQFRLVFAHPISVLLVLFLIKVENDQTEVGGGEARRIMGRAV